jgi:hypothetical protein
MRARRNTTGVNGPIFVIDGERRSSALPITTA